MVHILSTLGRASMATRERATDLSDISARLRELANRVDGITGDFEGMDWHLQDGKEVKDIALGYLRQIPAARKECIEICKDLAAAHKNSREGIDQNLGY